MFSGFSLLIAIIVFNVALLFVAFLSRRTRFVLQYNASILVLLTLLAAVRMILPLDFPFTIIIESYRILTAIIRFLNIKIFAETITVGTLIVLIWILGSVFFFIRAINMHRKGKMARTHYRLVDRLQVEKIINKMGLTHILVSISPDISVPHISGFFRPHIYLPLLEVSDESLEMIITHEMQHYHNRDSWIKLFYLLLSIVFWWNPIVHISIKELDRVLELRCDSALVRNMTEDEKTLYLESILAAVMFMKNSGQDMSVPISASALATSSPDQFLLQRIKLINSPKKKNPWIQKCIATVILIALFIGSYCVIVQSASFPDETYEVNPIIASADAYILITEDGQYLMYSNGEYIYSLTEDMLAVESIASLPQIHMEGDVQE